MGAAASPPHPALRVPLPGSGAAHGDWDAVRWTRDGIPVLLADADGFVAQIGDELDAPIEELGYGSLAYLARYLPQLIAPNAPLRRAIRGALERHCPVGVELAVELGCSVGVDLRTLGQFAQTTIGVDISIAALRAAKAQLAGEPLPLLRRVEGRSFASDAPIALGAVDGVAVALGNALDPPFFPEVADVVCAVNLLDTVPSPTNLIGQIDAILKPGGIAIITSPFAWNPETTAPEEALGGGSDEAWATLGTADGLVELMSGRMCELPYLRFEVLERGDVPWTLREHARAVTTYDVHVLVVRKTRSTLPQ